MAWFMAKYWEVFLLLWLHYHEIESMEPSQLDLTGIGTVLSVLPMRVF